MRTLTKKERALVIKAAVRIDSGQEDFTCFALNHLTSGNTVHYSDLTHRYAKWAGLEKRYDGYKQLEEQLDPECYYYNYDYREARVLLLLTFAEVG